LIQALGLVLLSTLASVAPQLMRALLQHLVHYKGRYVTAVSVVLELEGRVLDMADALRMGFGVKGLGFGVGIYDLYKGRCIR
jgi:hypothetical protein